MGRIIAIANQKGGVGKTTTTINLSSCLAELGQKVLVVDTDPQGNTTSGLGIDKEAAELTVYQLMIGECQVRDCLVHTDFERLDVIPSNVNLAGAEIDLIGIEDREFILKKRFCYSRLSTVAQHADGQCHDSGRYGAGSYTVRVLCAGRIVTVDAHYQSCSEKT